MTYEQFKQVLTLFLRKHKIVTDRTDVLEDNFLSLAQITDLTTSCKFGPYPHRDDYMLLAIQGISDNSAEKFKDYFQKHSQEKSFYYYAEDGTFKNHYLFLVPISAVWNIFPKYQARIDSLSKEEPELYARYQALSSESHIVLDFNIMQAAKQIARYLENSKMIDTSIRSIEEAKKASFNNQLFYFAKEVGDYEVFRFRPPLLPKPIFEPLYELAEAHQIQAYDESVRNFFHELTLYHEKTKDRDKRYYIRAKPGVDPKKMEALFNPKEETYPIFEEMLRREQALQARSENNGWRCNII